MHIVAEHEAPPLGIGDERSERVAIGSRRGFEAHPGPEDDPAQGLVDLVGDGGGIEAGLELFLQVAPMRLLVAPLLFAGRGERRIRLHLPPATETEPAKGPLYDEIDTKKAPIIREVFERIANGEPDFEPEVRNRAKAGMASSA